MNKIKGLIVLCSLLLLGCLSVQAQSNELTLSVIKNCNLIYAGDNCNVELKVNNNTGKVLTGKFILDTSYQGICGSSFDGIGIEIATSTFTVEKGESNQNVKIDTVSNLCPGQYTFKLSLSGDGEYVSPSVVSGGGGGGYYYTTTTNDEELQKQLLLKIIDLLKQIIELTKQRIAFFLHR